MALNEIPRYSEGVALTLDSDTWYVVTGPNHPYGSDVVGYPSYRDAYEAWKETVSDSDLT